MKTHFSQMDRWLYQGVDADAVVGECDSCGQKERIEYGDSHRCPKCEQGIVFAHINKPPEATAPFKGYWIRVDGKTHPKRRAPYTKKGKSDIFKMMRKIKGGNQIEIFTSRRETPLWISNDLIEELNINLICEIGGQK